MATTAKTRPIEELFKELDDSTGKLSTKAYTVVLGVLGLVWSALLADKGFLHALGVARPGWLLILGGAAFVALIADGLHYFCKVNRDISTLNSLPDTATQFSFDHSSRWGIAARLAVAIKMITSVLLPFVFAGLVIHTWLTVSRTEAEGSPAPTASGAPNCPNPDSRSRFRASLITTSRPFISGRHDRLEGDPSLEQLAIEALDCNHLSALYVVVGSADRQPLSATKQTYNENMQLAYLRAHEVALALEKRVAICGPVEHPLVLALPRGPQYLSLEGSTSDLAKDRVVRVYGFDLEASLGRQAKNP